MYSYDRQLILEDGTVYKGYGFGANRALAGEVVFNTGMRVIKKLFQTHHTMDNSNIYLSVNRKLWN